MKTNIIIISILLLASILRFSFLDRFPIGYYSDEAAFSYNAYSLLQTGKDEYGTVLPVALKSFGDYKAALYSYYLIPFVGVFGLSEVSTRAGSAFLGVAEVLLIFYLANLIFKSKKLSLLSSYLVAVSPFSLQFGRMVHENNLVVFLITLGIYLLLTSLKNKSYLLLSPVFFAASMYTYHDARVFVPMILITIFLIYKSYLFSIKKEVIISIIIFFILLLPLLRLFNNNAFWSRPKNTIIFSDLGIINQINEGRGEDISVHYQYPKIFHNKIIVYPLKFLENYFTHFDSPFLIFSGDPVKIYKTVGNGIIYIVVYPLLFIGFYYLMKINNPHKWIILFWLLLAPVPSSLTRFVPSASRLMVILPPLSIIPALGIFFSLNHIRKYSLLKNLFIYSLSILITVNIAYYLHSYYINTPYKYFREWHYGTRQLYNEIEKNQDQYDIIWVSKKAWGYIYALFYLKYPPDKFQPQANLGPPDEYGFGWIDGFDKYRFGKLPDSFDLSKKILYVLSPDELQNKNIKPLKSIYYPDGVIAYILIDTESISKTSN